MRKTISLCALLIALLLPSIALVTYAHPGRTDGRGGHTDHSTGEYHYHHGYSAHDHYDMDGDGDIDCPYDFVDNTNHNSGEEIRGEDKSYFDGLLNLLGIELSWEIIFCSFLLVSAISFMLSII